MKEQNSILETAALLWWDSLKDYQKQARLISNNFTGTIVTDGWKVKCYNAEHPSKPLLESPTDNKAEEGGYTKGEWLVNELSLNESAFEILTDTPNWQNMNGNIAYIKCSNYTVPGMAKANAELIASAPKLKADNLKLLSDVNVLREALEGLVKFNTEGDLVGLLTDIDRTDGNELSQLFIISKSALEKTKQ